MSAGVFGTPLKKPEQCVDVQRAEHLQRMQRAPNAVYDTVLTTGALSMLTRLALTNSGRLPREQLVGGEAKPRGTAEDARELLARGWIQEVGVKFIQITDEGNACVCALLAYARVQNTAEIIIWRSAEHPDDETTVLLATEEGVEPGFRLAGEWCYAGGGKVEAAVHGWAHFPIGFTKSKQGGGK